MLKLGHGLFLASFAIVAAATAAMIDRVTNAGPWAAWTLGACVFLAGMVGLLLFLRMRERDTVAEEMAELHDALAESRRDLRETRGLLEELATVFEETVMKRDEQIRQREQRLVARVQQLSQEVRRVSDGAPPKAAAPSAEAKEETAPRAAFVAESAPEPSPEPVRDEPVRDEPAHDGPARAEVMETPEPAAPEPTPEPAPPAIPKPAAEKPAPAGAASGGLGSKLDALRAAKTEMRRHGGGGGATGEPNPRGGALGLAGAGAAALGGAAAVAAQDLETAFVDDEPASEEDTLYPEERLYDDAPEAELAELEPDALVALARGFEGASAPGREEAMAAATADPTDAASPSRDDADAESGDLTAAALKDEGLWGDDEPAPIEASQAEDPEEEAEPFGAAATVVDDGADGEEVFEDEELFDDDEDEDAASEPEPEPIFVAPETRPRPAPQAAKAAPISEPALVEEPATEPKPEPVIATPPPLPEPPFLSEPPPLPEPPSPPEPTPAPEMAHAVELAPAPTLMSGPQPSPAASEPAPAAPGSAAAAEPSPPAQQPSAPAAAGAAPLVKSLRGAKRKKARPQVVIEPDALQTLRYALDNDSVDLYLQPVVNLPDQDVRYFEALSRVRGPDDRSIMPERYLRVAAEAGLITEVDNLLLSRCMDVVTLLKESGREIGVFVNFTAHSLRDDVFFDQFVDQMTARADLSRQVIFEFSQATVKACGLEEWVKLARLTELGFRFSMDNVFDWVIDFVMLSQRGFSFIKIGAPLFKRGMADNGALIRSEDLDGAFAERGVSLVLEKIEDEATRELALKNNVRFGQGFLFGEPQLITEEEDDYEDLENGA